MKFLNLVIFGVALFIFCIYCFSSYSIFQTSFSQVSQQLEWSHGKDMPKPREEISGTVLNDEIYIVGGSADNKIYVIGGKLGNDRVIGVNEIFLPATTAH
jgi:hypothetical protein